MSRQVDLRAIDAARTLLETAIGDPDLVKDLMITEERHITEDGTFLGKVLRIEVEYLNRAIR